MLYKKIEIYNTNELFVQENGAVRWSRVPKDVLTSMETENGKAQACCSTVRVCNTVKQIVGRNRNKYICYLTVFLMMTIKAEVKQADGEH